MFFPRLFLDPTVNGVLGLRTSVYQPLKAVSLRTPLVCSSDIILTHTEYHVYFTGEERNAEKM